MIFSTFVTLKKVEKMEVLPIMIVLLTWTDRIGDLADMG